MRTYQHIIDTNAVRQVINAIPEHCVVRELTERDYGIDLMIELFLNAGKDKFGNEQYETTGHVCYLQIKGTNEELKINRKKEVAYNIDKKSLLYIEKFSTPFILTRVCTLKGKEMIYFLWLQRYIADVLDVETPHWRTDNKKSLTVYIPTHNHFKNNFSKIEKISCKIKWLEELIEYCEMYSNLKMYLPDIITYGENYNYFDELILDLKRITHLSTLLTKNYCCVDKSAIEELINYLQDVRNGEKIPKVMNDFPHDHNMRLLSTTITSSRIVEKMSAENDGDTTF